MTTVDHEATVDILTAFLCGCLALYKKLLFLEVLNLIFVFMIFGIVLYFNRHVIGVEVILMFVTPTCSQLYEFHLRKSTVSKRTFNVRYGRIQYSSL